MKKKLFVLSISIAFLFALYSTYDIYINKAVERENTSMNMHDNDQTNEMSMSKHRAGNIQLAPSGEPEKELAIPPLLAPVSSKNNEIEYDVVAQKGSSQIKKGQKTNTLGYNGNYLGPVIKIKKGQTVTLNTKNELDRTTSFHWHGLEVPSSSDGGPHQIVSSGETKKITFTVNQEAASLWFHPHPEGDTAAQVYEGLAGLVYVEDSHSDELNIPKDYGINDIPLIVQDRSFDENNQLNYDKSYNADGTQGETLLINGTINPYIKVTETWIRYRIFNGSNSRNFTFNLKDKSAFYQIATDGGFLNHPVELDELILAPGERAEILINTEKSAPNDTEITLMANNIAALHMKKNNITKKTDFSTSKRLNNLVENLNTAGLKTQKIELNGMSHMVNINNNTFNMNRIDLFKKKDQQEVWEVHNRNGMMGGMIHPFHIHGVQFRILSRNDEVAPENEQGWKDTVLVNPNEQVNLLVKFQQDGVFMYHCHILEHEELGMMGQLEVS